MADVGTEVVEPRRRPRSPSGEGAIVELAPAQKRQAGADALEVAPAQNRHSGMFREQTIREVSLAAERLRQPSPLEAAELLQVLEELADYVVDERVLERTKIGKDVAALQKHEDADVASRARALVAQWKRDRETRNRVVKSFVEKTQLALKDARRLEEGLFNAACPLGYLDGEGFRSYQRHFLRLSTHLRTKGPGSLRQRLLDGQICPLEVAFQPDEELLTQERREQVVAQKEAGLLEALATRGAVEEGTVTEEYVCPKCSGSRTMYKEVQTGWHNDQQDLTILVSCLDCGERWKSHDDHGLGGS